MLAPFPYAGELCALLSSLFWATSFLVFARLGKSVPAGALNLGKNTTATVCFGLLFLVLYGRPWPPAMDGTALALFAASGFVGLTLCDTLLFASMIRAGPQRTTLMMTVAVPLTQLAVLLPPWEEGAPGALQVLGMLCCLGGVAVAVLEHHPDPVAKQQLRRGMALGLLAALGQTTGVLLARLGFYYAQCAPGGQEANGLVDAGHAAAVRLFVGSLGLVLLALVLRQGRAWTGALRQPGVMPRLAGAAVVGTFLGIWMNQAGLTWAEHTGVATTLNQLTPVWLIPLTTLVLGERHGLRSWLSTLLAVAGVVLIGLGS